MPSINMIASRRADKRRQEQNLRKLVYGLSAEVGCVILAISVMTVRQVALHSHVAELSAQLRALEPQVARIQQLQQQTDALKPKVKTLDGAKADTIFWYSNLYAITNSLPDKAWLTALGVTGGGATGSGGAPGSAAGGDPTVSISGVTLNQALVGEAMLRMNQSPGMDHIDLSFVQQQKTGATDTVAFQMTAHLKPEPSADTPKGGSTNVQKS